MGKTQKRAREKNNNWKGGRLVAPNGYIKILVGTDHHLADSKGYAYEHRVVAEEKLGRRLRKGEIVHHVNHDKTNNEPDNLDVLTRANHLFEHRNATSVLKHPSAPNETVACACGCEHRFEKFDSVGRPRKFIRGHQNDRHRGKANHERAGL